MPSILQEIQFIKFYLFNPCEAPFMLYIETALPTAGEIALELLAFDFVQFVKTIFKPKWVRSGRHTRKGHRGKRKGGGIPEIADLVAEQLDPDGTMKIERWNLPGAILFEIGEIADRVLWTIFLVEAYESLFVNTIIGVIESDKSHCPYIGRALRQDSYIVIGGAGPSDRSINVDTLSYQHLVGSPTGFGADLPAGRYAVVFTATAQATQGDIDIQPFIHVGNDSGEYDVMGSTWHIVEDDTADISVTATVDGPAGVQWRADIVNNWATLTRVRAWIMQIGEA